MHEIHLDTVDSTNVYGKLHFQSFLKDQITCITAEEQTAGRGRHQRPWISPRGVNLYVTFCFCLPPQTPQITTLAQVMAYSLASLLTQEGFHPEVKWPNDIQLRGKKVSGILCEASLRSDRAEIILGIGINVNLDAEELAQIDQPATSLKVESGKSWDRQILLKKLQKQFVKDLETFQNKGFAPFHEALERWLAKKGETIRCFDGEKEWVGICHSLATTGQLNLLLPDQTFHLLSSGDLRYE